MGKKMNLIMPKKLKIRRDDGVCKGKMKRKLKRKVMGGQRRVSLVHAQTCTCFTPLPPVNQP